MACQGPRPSARYDCSTRLTGRTHATSRVSDKPGGILEIRQVYNTTSTCMDTGATRLTPHTCSLSRTCHSCHAKSGGPVAREWPSLRPPRPGGCKQHGKRDDRGQHVRGRRTRTSLGPYVLRSCPWSVCGEASCSMESTVVSFTHPDTPFIHPQLTPAP